MENFCCFIEVQCVVEKCGVVEVGLVIIKGFYGVGKSEIVECWVVDNSVLFFCVKEIWIKWVLIDEVVMLLGLDMWGCNSEVQVCVIGWLVVDMLLLVFDEVDFLICGDNSKLLLVFLECVCDIIDVIGSICYLVGMEKFGDCLV